MRFDVVPAELPTATLLPGAAHARHRVIGVHLRRWLGDRWSWLRPRTVPMLVAFVGMLAVLGSTTYLSSFALDTPRLAPITRHANMPHTCRHRQAPAAVHVAPAAPADHEVAISLAP